MELGETLRPPSMPDEHKRVEVTFNPVEDPEEAYLYAEGECAISSMSVLPLYRNLQQDQDLEVSEIETAT